MCPDHCARRGFREADFSVEVRGELQLLDPLSYLDFLALQTPERIAPIVQKSVA